jgi:hypothetical protein
MSNKIDRAHLGLAPRRGTKTLRATLGLRGAAVASTASGGGGGPFIAYDWRTRHRKNEENERRDSILVQNRIARILAHRRQEEETALLLFYAEAESWSH